MNTLENLTQDQKIFIASMPYRVGLMVSESDTTGGVEANVKEKIALGNIIHGFAEQVFGSELLQYVMQETINKKDDWNEWQGGLEDVPEQAKKSCEILREYFDEKEVHAYAIRLMEIAEAVALAFRERQEISTMEEMKLRLQYTLGQWRSRGKRGAHISFDQYLNISPSERQALSALSDALGQPQSI